MHPVQHGPPRELLYQKVLPHPDSKFLQLDSMEATIPVGAYPGPCSLTPAPSRPRATDNGDYGRDVGTNKQQNRIPRRHFFEIY